jgi:hypothetical protein
MPIPKIFQQKLFRYPVFIILHIAMAVGVVTVFRLIRFLCFPHVPAFIEVEKEVELAFLSTVILGLGLCWALLTNFLIQQWRKRKENQKQGDINNENK